MRHWWYPDVFFKHLEVLFWWTDAPGGWRDICADFQRNEFWWMFWFKMGSDQNSVEVSVVVSSQDESLSFWMFCWSGTAIMSLVGCYGILCDAAMKNRTYRMWRLNPVICGYHPLEPCHWCLGILHISLTGAMIPVIDDAWLNCSVSRWWWRSLPAAGLVRNVCWIVPSCDCVYQCFQCESFEQFVQLDGYLLVTVCVLVKGLGVVWVLRALGLLREKMFLRREPL